MPFTENVSKKQSRGISDDLDITDNLIEKIGNDDMDAFEEFYIKSNKALYSYILSFTKNHHDAVELVHDTYLKIRAAAHLYKPMGKPMAWVFTVARNLTMNRFSRQNRFQDIDQDSYSLEDSLELSYISDPIDKLVLESTLKILDDDESQIVLLYAVSGMKHKEISEILGLNQNTVISKYNRSLKKLRDHLEKEEKNYEGTRN